jgi:3-phosphoshikimate 1-carboxyvinyltransferase
MVLANSRHSDFRVDAGNSGTTARLIAGLAAGQGLRCEITGDASLCRRPMKRVAEPLERMGARVSLSDAGTLPAVITGQPLHGIEYEMPVPSAQVKSAVLIAGLFAEGDTSVIESVPTRDHTEILLKSMGSSITRANGRVTVRGRDIISGTSVTVPGDFSSAAFFLVAALLVPSSRVVLPFTGVNPRRLALFEVLRAMGGRVSIETLHRDSTEPAGDIAATSSALHGVTVEGPAVIASMIDEIPILAVAATQAEGRTVIRGAQELRHKETDRIDAMVSNLRAMGARIEAAGDDMWIEGPTPLRGAAVSSFGDHRIAMAMAVAGLVADGPTDIADAGCIAISYPNFFRDLRALAR